MFAGVAAAASGWIADLSIPPKQQRGHTKALATISKVVAAAKNSNFPAALVALFCDFNAQQWRTKSSPRVRAAHSRRQGHWWKSGRLQRSHADADAENERVGSHQDDDQEHVDAAHHEWQALGRADGALRHRGEPHPLVSPNAAQRIRGIAQKAGVSARGECAEPSRFRSSHGLQGARARLVRLQQENLTPSKCKSVRPES